MLLTQGLLSSCQGSSLGVSGKFLSRLWDQLMTKWHLKIQTVGYTAAEFTLVAAAIATVVVIAKYAL